MRVGKFLVGLLVSVQASPVSPSMVSGQVRLSDGVPVAGAQVVLFDVMRSIRPLRRSRRGGLANGVGIRLRPVSARGRPIPGGKPSPLTARRRSSGKARATLLHEPKAARSVL